MARFTGHTITSDSALGGKIIEKSLRFNRSGSHRINFTAASEGNRRIWTKSFWIKRTSEDRRMLHAYYIGSGDVAAIEFQDNGNFAIYDYYGGYRMYMQTSAKFRDCTAWTHFVVSLDTPQSTSSERIKIYVNGSRVTAFDTATYPSQNLEVSFNQNVLEAWGTEGTNQRLHFDGYLTDIWYIDGQALDPSHFGFTESQTGIWKPKNYSPTGPNNGTTWSSTTNMNANVFDGRVSGTNFLAQVSNGYYTATTAPFTIKQSLAVVTGNGYHWGARLNGSTEVTTGNLSSTMGVADRSIVNFDLSSVSLPLDITNLQIKAGTGSSGSTYIYAIVVDGVVLMDGDSSNVGKNGYHLEFKDDSGTTATTMGKDTSGRGNNWTPVNFSVASDFMTDIVTDSPTNNFCVLNYNGGSGNKPVDGGLSGSAAGTSAWRHTYGTFPLTRGKWYWEYRFSGNIDGSNGIYMGLGHADLTYERDINSNSADMYGRQNQDRYANGTNTGSHFANVSSGDTVQFAFDADTGVMWSGLNNTWTGADPSTGNSPSFTGIDASKGYVPMTGSYGSNNYNKVNFGQQGFKYTPPSGFKAICSEFMETPEVTILNPKKHFGDLYYTGNSGTQSITGLEFQPDFAWIKSRSNNHHSSLTDSVRGMLKVLSTSRSDIGEYNESAGLNSFLSNGLGFNGNNYFSVNVNGDNFVAWCFKGGGSSNTYNIDGVGYANAAAAGLNGGTITPTGTSINTKSGLSIIAYTGNGTNGASMSHGLPRAPKLMIHRSRGTGRNWYTITTAIDGTPDYFYLNLTNTANNSAVTAPTSDLMYFTSSQESNNNGENYIVYAFCEIPGYCKIGTYKGFGNENGPVVYCGFRPKFVLVKSTTHGEHWNIPVDTYNYNGVDKTVSTNLSNAERDMSGSGLYGDAMDYLADGFKIKNIDGNYNRGGATFFYMAIADVPNLPHFNQYPTGR